MVDPTSSARPTFGELAMKTVPTILVLAACWAVAGGSATADWHVWTLARTERVSRQSPAGTGTAVALAAARGEWESFQILMRSDEPIASIDTTGIGNAAVFVFIGYPHRVSGDFTGFQASLLAEVVRGFCFSVGRHQNRILIRMLHSFDRPVTDKLLQCGVHIFTRLHQPPCRQDGESLCGLSLGHELGDFPSPLLLLPDDVLELGTSVPVAE